ncbi:MAG: tyrosine-type recombinase/integrase [Taibaiella sp.]|nr:tyrosine-type recombinase/integrase [Taibaiella sp.]
MVDGELEHFLNYIRSEKRYSANTLSAYTTDLKQFVTYLAIQFTIQEINAITHFHIRSWLAELKENKEAASTLNRKISSLNSFFKYALKHGIAQSNPVKQLHAQRLPERLPVYLKQKETIHLLDELQFEQGFAGNTDRLICELLYATGMRRNELIELKEKNIEWSLKQLRVLGKGNKERLIPVSQALLDMVKDYLQLKQEEGIYNTEHLLCLPSGQPLYAVYVYRTVKKYLSEVTTQKKKSPHVLRHTFATHLLGNGANIQAIKDLLGHSSLAATQVYTHSSIERLKEIHMQNHPRG